MRIVYKSVGRRIQTLFLTRYCLIGWAPKAFFAPTVLIRFIQGYAQLHSHIYLFIFIRYERPYTSFCDPDKKIVQVCLPHKHVPTRPFFAHKNLQTLSQEITNTKFHAASTDKKFCKQVFANNLVF